MKITRTTLLGLVAVLGSSLLAPAWAGDMADKAVGVWLRANKGWHVEFSMCGDNLCGEIISGEGVDKKTGESVVGIQMLYDLEKAGDDRWKGKMYNPGDGGTYKGKVIMLSDDELKMAGCMMGFICRSEKWSRVSAPSMDDAMDDAMDGVEDAMDEAGDSVEDAMDDVEDAVEEMEDAVEEAADDQ